MNIDCRQSQVLHCKIIDTKHLTTVNRARARPIRAGRPRRAPAARAVRRSAQFYVIRYLHLRPLKAKSKLGYSLGKYGLRKYGGDWYLHHKNVENNV